MPRHPPCALCILTFWYSLSQYIALYWALSFFLFDIFRYLLDVWLDLIWSIIVTMCSFQGTSLSNRWLLNGDNEIRTRDLLLARQALSQLSYTPRKSGSHLLSHTVSSIVPSADQVLTIVFGMCTGVTPDRIATRSIEHLVKFFWTQCESSPFHLSRYSRA